MSISNQIASTILNGIPVGIFLAYFIISLVGLLINLLYDKEIKFHFSGSWFKNRENFKRVVGSILLILVGLLSTKAVFGIDLNWMIAVGMPFASDTILGFIMKKKNV